MMTEESENGSSEEDNAKPANPQARHQASFPGGVAAPTDTSKGAAGKGTAAATQSLELPGGQPKSKSPLGRVGAKISKFLRRTPPKAHSECSPQKKVVTEKHWVPEARGAPSTSAAGAEETPMELVETPPEPIPQPDWMNPRLKTCPPDLYGALFDPFCAGMEGPVERIPLDPTKGMPPSSITDPAPLAKTEDLCSPAGVDFEEEGASGASAPSSSSHVTTAVVHGSDEPPRRSPPPAPPVPPPQPEVPPPEPEERAEKEQRELRPRRKGEPRR